MLAFLLFTGLLVYSYCRLGCELKQGIFENNLSGFGWLDARPVTLFPTLNSIQALTALASSGDFIISVVFIFCFVFVDAKCQYFII